MLAFRAQLAAGNRLLTDPRSSVYLGLGVCSAIGARVALKYDQDQAGRLRALALELSTLDRELASPQQPDWNSYEGVGSTPLWHGTVERCWIEYALRGPMILRADAGERCTVYGESVGPGGAYIFARSARGAEGLVLREWVSRDQSDTAAADASAGPSESCGTAQ